MNQPAVPVAGKYMAARDVLAAAIHPVLADTAPHTTDEWADLVADAILEAITPEGSTREQIEAIDTKRRELPEDERKKLEAADAPMLRIQLGYMLERAQRAEANVDAMADAAAMLATAVARRAEKAEARIAAALRLADRWERYGSLDLKRYAGLLRTAVAEPETPTEGMGNASYISSEDRPQVPKTRPYPR